MEELAECDEGNECEPSPLGLWDVGAWLITTIPLAESRVSLLKSNSFLGRYGKSVREACRCFGNRSAPRKSEDDMAGWDKRRSGYCERDGTERSIEEVNDGTKLAPAVVGDGAVELGMLISAVVNAVWAPFMFGSNPPGLG